MIGPFDASAIGAKKASKATMSAAKMGRNFLVIFDSNTMVKTNVGLGGRGGRQVELEFPKMATAAVDTRRV